MRAAATATATARIRGGVRRSILDLCRQDRDVGVIISSDRLLYGGG